MKSTLSVLVLSAITATTLEAQSAKTLAQRVVEEIKAAHPEITGIELSATKPGKGCQNIAATEVNEIGEKCDKEDVMVMKTGRPFVEQEKKGFEVTLPIHDSAGKVIAAAGLDYRREAGRTKDAVASEAAKVATEIEQRLTSGDALFQPVH
jgi:hypothetical protein